MTLVRTRDYDAASELAMCDKHHFVFEFDKAYTDQLIKKLEASPAHPLDTDVASSEKGIYALYRKGKIVYAGKALQTTLRRRLNEHKIKIAGRKNISLREMSCRFLIIEGDWFIRAGEHALIVSYKPEWNTTGFGSHVPGRGRLHGSLAILPSRRMMRWLLPCSGTLLRVPVERC